MILSHDVVEQFLARNCVDAEAARIFRDQRPDVKQEVLGKGDVIHHKNPSAALQKHIREAKLVMNQRAGQGSGPVTPMLSGKDEFYPPSLAPPSLANGPATGFFGSGYEFLARRRDSSSSPSRSPRPRRVALRARSPSVSPDGKLYENPLAKICKRGATQGRRRSGSPVRVAEPPPPRIAEPPPGDEAARPGEPIEALERTLLQRMEDLRAENEAGMQKMLELSRRQEERRRHREECARRLQRLEEGLCRQPAARDVGEQAETEDFGREEARRRRSRSRSTGGSARRKAGSRSRASCSSNSGGRRRQRYPQESGRSWSRGGVGRRHGSASRGDSRHGPSRSRGRGRGQQRQGAGWGSGSWGPEQRSWRSRSASSYCLRRRRGR